jgi:hypothetical protein
LDDSIGQNDGAGGIKKECIPVTKTNKREKTKMENKDTGLVTAVEGIEEEIGQFVGTTDQRQKRLLANLGRLFHSLRGPEDVLDHGDYSRPFPAPARTRQQNPDKTGSSY